METHANELFKRLGSFANVTALLANVLQYLLRLPVLVLWLDRDGASSARIGGAATVSPAAAALVLEQT